MLLLSFAGTDPSGKKFFQYSETFFAAFFLSYRITNDPLWEWPDGQEKSPYKTEFRMNCVKSYFTMI